MPIENSPVKCSLSHTFHLNILCAAAAFLAGCSTPGQLSLSLTDLGTEERDDYGSARSDLFHRRAYNITGLGATDSVGQLSADPDPESFKLPGLLFSKRTLPDVLSPRISTECSRVVQVDYSGAESQDVAVLKNKLVALSEISAANVELSLHNALRGAAIEAINDIKSEFSTDQVKTDARTKEVLSALKLALPASTATTLDQLKEEQLSATKALADSKRKVETAQAAVDSARDKNGLIVTHWVADSTQNVGLTSGAGARVAASSDKKRRGYLILGNPRTTTLVPGDDLALRACKASKENEHCGSSPRTGLDSYIGHSDLYTTTFQLLAQHWAWFDAADYTRSFDAQVDTSALISALGEVSGGSLKAKIDALKLNARFSITKSGRSDLGGVLSKPKVTIYPFYFHGDKLYDQSVLNGLRRKDGYGTIYSVRTTLDSYIISTSANGRRPSNESCSKNPKDKLIQLVDFNAQLTCDKECAEKYAIKFWEGDKK